MGNGEKICSMTSPCEENGDEDESEEKNESSMVKDGGGSSSNSTVEESDKKQSVRPYVRSKMPRLRWTPDLHLRFLHAVERIGGQERATPKLVLQLMDIKGLNIAHVKSHLQMHRSKKIDEPNQLGLTDHRIFVEGVDRNIYNLSQLPLIPRQISNISFPRYGDHASMNGHGKWMQNSFIGHQAIRPGFYGNTLAERSHYRSANLDHLFSRTSHFNGGSTWRTNEASNEESWSQSRQNPIQLIQQRVLGQKVSSDRSINPGLKRKASDIEVLDLNLSLGVNEEEIDDEHLALSLSSSKMIQKMKECDENARGASTLDLTL